MQSIPKHRQAIFYLRCVFFSESQQTILWAWLTIIARLWALEYRKHAQIILMLGMKCHACRHASFQRHISFPKIRSPHTLAGNYCQGYGKYFPSIRCIRLSICCKHTSLKYFIQCKHTHGRYLPSRIFTDVWQISCTIRMGWNIHHTYVSEIHKHGRNLPSIHAWWNILMHAYISNILPCIQACNACTYGNSYLPKVCKHASNRCMRIFYRWLLHACTYGK